MGVGIGIAGAGSFAPSFVGLVQAHPLVARPDERDGVEWATRDRVRLPPA